MLLLFFLAVRLKYSRKELLSLRNSSPNAVKFSLPDFIQVKQSPQNEVRASKFLWAFQDRVGGYANCSVLCTYVRTYIHKYMYFVLCSSQRNSNTLFHCTKKWIWKTETQTKQNKGCKMKMCTCWRQNIYYIRSSQQELLLLWAFKPFLWKEKTSCFK